jgi:outer membrane biosynthesis protein TonB
LKLKTVALCLSVLCTPGVMARQDPSKLEAGKTSQTATVAQAQQPHRVHVKEDVQKEKLVHMVSPLYPPASLKRMDGTVVLHVLIGKRSAVKSAKYVSGPENLMTSAVNAVLQWRYKPTLMNGLPVEVDTTVSVVFPPLAKEGPPATNK